jgi:hypothetical protein
MKGESGVPMTRLRKVLLALFVLFGGLAGVVVVVPPLLWGDGVDYSRVSSIKAAREYQDPALLAKAWALPVAAAYRADFDFQGNPSFCGPTSMVDVMRSLHQSVDQKTVLDGTGISTFLGVLPGGISLDQVAAIARTRLKKDVTVVRDIDLPTFRQHLRMSNDPSRRYVVNFTRGPLFGTGGGHHSPIGGYLSDEDLVFVLDVNKKYGPWLVKPERLYEATNTVDRQNGKKRGLLVIEQAP